MAEHAFIILSTCRRVCACVCMSCGRACGPRARACPCPSVPAREPVCISARRTYVYELERRGEGTRDRIRNCERTSTRSMGLPPMRLRIGKPTPCRHIRRAACALLARPSEGIRAAARGGEGDANRTTIILFPSRSPTQSVLFVNKGLRRRGWRVLSLDSDQVSFAECRPPLRRHLLRLISIRPLLPARVPLIVRLRTASRDSDPRKRGGGFHRYETFLISVIKRRRHPSGRSSSPAAPIVADNVFSK